MADVTQKHDFSLVFGMRARTGGLKGRARRHRCCLPTNPLTDRHSGHLTYLGLELGMISPATSDSSRQVAVLLQGILNCHNHFAGPLVYQDPNLAVQQVESGIKEDCLILPIPETSFQELPLCLILPSKLSEVMQPFDIAIIIANLDLVERKAQGERSINGA